MRSFLRMAAVAGALAIAGPASAQYTFLSPDVKPPPLRLDGWDNVVRVNVGAGFYNSGWYNCYYGFYAGTCSTGSYTSFIPFLVGPQVDFNLGGVSNVSVGLTIGIGTVKSSYFDGTQDVHKSSSVTMWEPTLDYVVKPGGRSDGEVARFRIGGGLIIGPDSQDWRRRPPRRRRLVLQRQPPRDRARPDPGGRDDERLLDRRPAAPGLAGIPLLEDSPQ